MIALNRQHRSLCFLALCREAWDVIRKPYKTPDKKNWPKSFPKSYLRTSGKGMLYEHSERPGVLYGNHINIVGRQGRKAMSNDSVTRSLT
jgi:hypothetical protein